MNMLDKAVDDTATGSAESVSRLAPVDEADYRAAMARFASGITITTTRVDGIDHAMTASAFTSVSLRPPLVLVCVEKVARFHAAVLASGSWGASILASTDHQVATWLATRGRSLTTQLDDISTWRGVTGAPLLTGAIAVVECRTWAVHDGGDHSIVLGEVVAARVADDEFVASDPLVYFAGDYRSVSGAAPKRLR